MPGMVGRDVIVQKTAGIAFIICALVALSPLQTALLVSALGQGHFLLAYLYQWKAGKVSYRGAAFFAVAAICFFALALSGVRFEWFITLVAAFFFMHHVYDETTLTGLAQTRFRPLEQLLIIAPASALMADSAFGTNLFLWSLWLNAALVGALIILSARGKHDFDVLSAYFAIATLTIVGVGWALPDTRASQLVTSGIILFHYVCWYLFYYARLRQNPVRRTAYVRDVILVHAVVLPLFLAFIFDWRGAYWLSFIFAPVSFYVWAALHIGVSFSLALKARFGS